MLASSDQTHPLPAQTNPPSHNTLDTYPQQVAVEVAERERMRERSEQVCSREAGDAQSESEKETAQCVGGKDEVKAIRPTS
jgi:hypothetical protein